MWQKNKKYHGGGALIAVTNVRKSSLGLETDLEALLTQTRLTGYSLYLGCVYVQTRSDVDTWSELDKSLELVYNVMNHDCDCVLLSGDLNRPYIEWTPAIQTMHMNNERSTYCPQFQWTNPQYELCVGMCEYSLVQCNEDHT